MATPLVITCPDCKKQMKVPDSALGKKVRCKGCGGVVDVPAGRTPDTRVTTPEAQAKLAKMTEEEEAQNPYVVTEVSLAPRCPHCAYEVEENALICLHCGYNMIRRQRLESKVTYDLTFMDWLKWLGPGILCLIGIGLLVAACLYYHYQLPYKAMSQKDADALMEDRMKAFDLDGGWNFHPGIELWLYVIATWLIWKCLRFAFKRLVLNFTPAEKVKAK